MDRVLRLGIDPRAAAEGARGFRVATDEVAASAKRAEESLRTLTAQLRASSEAEFRARMSSAQSTVYYNRTQAEAERALLGYGKAQSAVVAGTVAMDNASKSSHVSLGRLGQELQTLTRHTTGAHIILIQVGKILTEMAVGGAYTLGALAGLSALGLAYRALTADTRAAREETEELISSINEAGRARARLGRAGMATTQSDLQAEVDRARQELRKAELRNITFRSPPQWATFGIDTYADKVEKAQEALNEATEALYRHNTAIRENWVEAQTLEGVSTRTADAIAREAQEMRDAARAAAELQVQLGLLTFESRDLYRRLPSTAELLGGTAYGSYADVEGGRRRFDVVDPVTGQRRPQPNFGTEPIVRPPPLWQIRHRTTEDPPPPTNWGRWGQAAQIGGGLLLGSGMAGSGYTAAGLSGGLNMAGQGASIAQVFSQTAGPIGAVVGAVGGLVTGLLGHAERAREAAQLLREATRQLELNIEARRAAAAGDTAEAERFRLLAQHEKELSEARKSGMSTSTIANLGLVQAEEKMALARDQAARAAQEEAEAQEKLADAMRRATEEAIRAEQLQNERAAGLSEIVGSFTLRQRRLTEGPDTPFYMTADYLEMFRRHADEKQRLTELGAGSEAQDLARLVHGMEEAALFAERQTHLVEEQLRVNQDQLRAQEQTVATLRQVHDSLADYGRSLLVGSQSPLSPWSQLQEARSQFDLMKNMALGGDVSAAQSLSGSGRTLLDASRGYNASGPGYVEDFRRVQEGVEQVRARFGAQASVEEQILAQIQAQTQSLEAQAAAAREQWAIERANWAEQLRRMQEQLDALSDIETGIAGLSAPTSGGSDAESAGQEAQNFFDWVRENFELGADGIWRGKGGGGDVNPPVSQAVVAELQDGFAQVVASQNATREEVGRLRDYIGAAVPA